MSLGIALWLTKLVHMGAIAIWVGGLIAIPMLLARRCDLEGRELERLQRQTRFLHVAVVSAAAFLAIGSGAVLIFLRETWVAWFSLKMLLVMFLVILHIVTGMGVVSTFEPEGRRGALMTWGSTLGIMGIAGGVLYLVLAKPLIEVPALRGDPFAPGALADLIAPVTEPVEDAIEPLTDAVTP